MRLVDAATLNAWLTGPDELALLDVREAGQFAEAHLFSAIPLPYSRLELDVGRLVPRPATRIVLCDDGDDVGTRAARRLAALGHTDVSLLAGGPEAWRRSGCPIFQGVNTVSKAFGEMVEHRHATPHIRPGELHERMARGDDVVIVDGRPLDEYRKMSIPGAISCPNGELALRIGTLAPDPATTIVVNCAGRTRSLIGAQSLRDLGLANPVYALENGTQGWFLAGYALEHGAGRTADDAVPPPATLAALRERTEALMQRHGVPTVDAGMVETWRADPSRTTYVVDVRTAAEFAADGIPGSVHAPGGQLVQATDQWLGVRRARVVLLNQDGVRAGVIARWLRAMGHDAVVLAAGAERELRISPSHAVAPPPLPVVPFARIANARVIDLRASVAHRRGHPPGAVWSTRARIARAAAGATAVALLADDPGIAAVAATDLREAGVTQIVHAIDAPLTEVTPHAPSDAESIDFVFFAHGRHDGDRAAAELYLRWETQLLDQLTDTERALLAPVSPSAPRVAAY
ncbi:MAG: sulfurtransferase [Burkholderiales bacterium]|nr:sulfurtransferase [Burkholderiales bacterium]